MQAGRSRPCPVKQLRGTQALVSLQKRQKAISFASSDLVPTILSDSAEHVIMNEALRFGGRLLRELTRLVRRWMLMSGQSREKPRLDSII